MIKMKKLTLMLLIGILVVGLVGAGVGLSRDKDVDVNQPRRDALKSIGFENVSYIDYENPNNQNSYSRCLTWNLYGNKYDVGCSEYLEVSGLDSWMENKYKEIADTIITGNQDNSRTKGDYGDVRMPTR